ncbi:MAG: hypothetical protein ACXWT4_20635 [Methylobacter sp.]
METIFDLTVEPYREWPWAIIPMLFFLYSFQQRFLSIKRRWPIWSLVFGFVTAALMVALPIWDYRRMKAVLESHDGVQSVQGRITDYRTETVRSRRAGESSYRTSIWEEFTVNGQRFGYYRSNYPSSASFTNNRSETVSFANGMTARITYVADPAYDNDLRILKLELGKDKTAVASGFDAFWKSFAAAVAKGDKQIVQTLTQFPFLFAGTPLPVEQFEQIWQGLFPPPIRDCFKSIQLLTENGKYMAFCGSYIFIFDHSAAGWRFSEFAADGEG